MENQSNKKTWFVTGASKGFGLEFVKQLLAQGNYVAATSRNKADLVKAAGQHDNFLPLEMDITNEESVAGAISRTLTKFGWLDVVVNNAGYGLFGSVEELSDAELRQNFEVNVFGSLNVIRQALPHLRAQMSGHIINISSIGGIVGNFPGFGIYCATKFAVNGFTEALAVEAKPFGINTTIVMPGYFRTNFLDTGSIALPKNPIEAYKSARESQELHQNTINGNQTGDPVKGVAAIIKAANEPQPPLYLLLGSDAVGMAEAKIATYEKEVNAWRSLSISTDY